MRGTCKLCGYVGDVSPALNCFECIERKIAEDPRASTNVARAARLLDLVAPWWGERLRAQAAVLVLLAFLNRCRGGIPRRLREPKGPRP